MVIVCCIDNRTRFKHKLIAKQFIPNPDNLSEVDHINRDRTDYHLSNLRWVSRSTNLENRTSYKGVEAVFVDDIPDDAIVIEWYETRTERKLFEANKYYYYRNVETDKDIFYAKITDKVYKILHHNYNKSGNELVYMKDIENKLVGVYINKFLFQHDLI